MNFGQKFMHFNYFSVKKKIFAIFFLAVLSCSVLSGIFSYYTSIVVLKERISDLHAGNVAAVANSLQNQLASVEQFSDFIYSNSEIKALLKADNRTDYSYIQRKERLEQMVSSWVMTLPNQPYYLIQIRNKEQILLSYSPLIWDLPYLINNQKIHKEYFADEMVPTYFTLQKNKLDIYEDVPRQKPAEHALFSTRKILDTTYHFEIGQSFLLIDSAFFSSITNPYRNRSGTNIYILDRQGSVVNLDQGTQDRVIQEIFAANPQGIGQMELANNLIFYQTLCDFKWMVVGVVPLSSLFEDGSIILTALSVGIVVSIVLGIVLWYFLMLKIYKPMENLKSAVEEIEKGNFHLAVPVTSNDEFGELSQSFNHMVQKINELFNDAVEKETNLKDAQFRALRAQINPHFLYNTLNSIRWMAVMQKAENIQTIISQLVRLLRSSAKQNSFVTIEDEIQSLEDYISIQQIAYGYKFKLECAVADEITEQQCPGFILQPILENAIIHGLLPKEGLGVITLSAARIDYEGAPCLELSMRDNGVGMTEEQLQHILSPHSPGNHETNSIGIANVNERLVMTYGAAYHLEFESEYGVYTTATIRIPWDRERRNSP